MKLSSFIQNEIELSERSIAKGNKKESFRHLERAHILGQSDTFWHTKVHWQMLKHGWSNRDIREIYGQIIRIVGALTKTPFAIYPKGNTGGANVYFFKPMPIPEDLKLILENDAQK